MLGCFNPVCLFLAMERQSLIDSHLSGSITTYEFLSPQRTITSEHTLRQTQSETVSGRGVTLI